MMARDKFAAFTSSLYSLRKAPSSRERTKLGSWKVWIKGRDLMTYSRVDPRVRARRRICPVYPVEKLVLPALSMPYTIIDDPVLLDSFSSSPTSWCGCIPQATLWPKQKMAACCARAYTWAEATK